ncbi:flavin-containing monooxygenase [Kineococcus aurantiacus]|uniref:Putative flavoprotein involved in K+ transport n=1 Tax=Kineococcus aurantiacus TaxID=37633 RepID=A0A7Y9DQV6_9ACTN|nr:NAD(P)/FAD-dependent oxidoreductase [Kineococcus aurantiacus]NYD25135.1 putative flavoprotein involved in K+ transport [Kineococcus aurantiacus]
MTDTATQISPTSSAPRWDDLDVLTHWLQALKEAVSSRDGGAIADLFQDDATARDLLVTEWDFRNAVGREELSGFFLTDDTSAVDSLTPRPVNRLFPGQENGRRTLGAFLKFTTGRGAGEGYVRLVEGPDGAWTASSLALSLSSLDSHPERVGERRPDGRTHGPILDRVGWAEQLDHEFTREDPTVVVLGAGHNGLMLAARLRSLGIRSLIVERNQRVGDNWRKRYSTLALHTPIVSDQLPYIPFPPTWTRFTPKDKLADFLECYATLLDLPVWTGTTASNVHHDQAQGRWLLDVVRPDGSRRSLNVKHLVFATGMNGEPAMPDLPGADEFLGTVMHAVDYRGHQPWIGKRAVVVGAGVSGHDLSQDLAEHGVDVTMIQRSPTYVMNTSSFHAVMHANHVAGTYTADEADLVNATIPFGDLPRFGPGQVAAAKAMDKELLERLAAAGFELSDGPDGQGVLGLIFGHNTTGYYYNAGASELIADGTIGLRHGSVTGLDRDGVVLDDGSTVPADLVVMAVGYRGPGTAAREVLGEEIADQLGEFAAVGPDREYGRLFRRSGIEGLWFMISLGIDSGRFYSKLLALQIAAAEAGEL